MKNTINRRDDEVLWTELIGVYWVLQIKRKGKYFKTKKGGYQGKEKSEEKIVDGITAKGKL